MTCDHFSDVLDFAISVGAGVTTKMIFRLLDDYKKSLLTKNIFLVYCK
jgi:hypothetical protein